MRLSLEEFKREADADEARRAAYQAQQAKDLALRQQQQRQPSVDWNAWWAAVDARIVAHIRAHDDYVANEMGAVIAAERKDMRGHVAERVMELHREFEPKLAAEEERLGTISEKLRVARWVDSEFIAQALTELRQAFERALEEKERSFEARLAALAEHLKAVPGRLPPVKIWREGCVVYEGEVASFEGSLWQAQRDTGQRPSGSDWVCVARAGLDGADGAEPKPCGVYDTAKTYERLDIVGYEGSSYLARRDTRGVPGLDPAWQLLAAHGARGERGAPGPRGLRGDKGETGATIYSWTVDATKYRAIFFTTDGKPGPELNLWPLFEAYYNEVSG